MSPSSPYRWLQGDLDARPLLLERLNQLGAHLHKVIYVTSGRRTLPEQRRIYDSGVRPAAQPTPNAPHIEGVAADASIGGTPINQAVSKTVLARFGLEPLKIADPPHVQIAGTVEKDAEAIRRMAQEGKFRPGHRLASASPAGQTIGGTTSNEAAGGPLGKVGDLLGVEIHPDAIALNIALLGGGAVLVYYGAALLLGIKQPIGTPARAAAKAAAVVPK